MSVLGFASAKGAPGVTTLVLALAHAWARTGRGVLLVEADPDGGSIATDVLHGQVPTDRGLVQLALYRGPDPGEAIREQSVQLDGSDIALLLGPTNPGQAVGAGAAWPVLAAGVRVMRTEPDLDVLIDLGRARSDAPSATLLPAMDRLVWVSTSRLSDVVATRAAVAAAGLDSEVGVVVVGPDRPYGLAQIADAVGVPVWGQVPHDRRAAEHTTGQNPWASGRFSPWSRAVRALTTSLQQPADPAAPAPVNAVGVGRG